MKKILQDVHTGHCCLYHGCKYGKDKTCTVMTKKAPQEYPCESCSMYDNIKTVEDVVKMTKTKIRTNLTTGSRASMVSKLLYQGDSIVELVQLNDMDLTLRFFQLLNGELCLLKNKKPNV